MKKRRIIITAFVLVLTSVVLVNAFSYIMFSNNPAYVVVNRWYDSDEKRINLNNFAVKDSVTYHTTITASQFVKPKLIIKARNMKIMIRTNGRIIIDTEKNAFSGLGTHYYIIDADNLDDGVVYLHLTPKKMLNSKIKGTIYLTTQNDFLYNRLVKKTPVKIAFVIFAHIILLALIYVKNKAFILEKILKRL